MNFERKIYKKLLDWKENWGGKYAVMIEGARRIGKSTIAEEFARNEYEDYILLDFNKESDDLKDLFVDYLDDLDNFFRRLFVLKGKTLKERKSVIIFDEVQRYPLARAAIKYLVQDGRFDYIETGSLISVKKNVKDITIPSEEMKIKMYPMDFEEFLLARGNKEATLLIREAFENKKPLGDSMHRRLMTLFREYMAVGGMPQAVCAFVEGKNFDVIDRIKNEIVNLYEDDLKKNDDNNKASYIYKSVASQIGKSKFILSKVDQNARFRDYGDSVAFIDESMICNVCKNVTDPGLLLELSAEENNFKIYMGDIGLLITYLARNNSLVGNEIYKSIIFDKLSDNLGMVYENVASQMLKSMGYELYFHEFYIQNKVKKENDEDTIRKVKYEIDFLVVKNNKLCPIEIKSSKSKKHDSFDTFKNKYKLKIQDKYVVHTKDFCVKDGITFIPFYMLLCLDDNE